MAKQTFTTGQVLTADRMNSLQSNDFNQTVSVKTAAYTLVAADKGTRIEFNTSGGVTCTVNTGLFDAGDTVVIQNRGAGDVTVTAGTATVDTAGSLVISQYQSATLYFISASASILFAGASGDLTAVTSGTGISISNAGGPVPTITNSMATEITAKGDLLVGTGNATYDNLAVGTNGYTLVADSSTSTGLKWAAAPASGALTLITSQSIGSGVSSIAVSNVFSSTYDNYCIIITGGTLSSTLNMQLQLGSTTTGYYESTYYFGPTSGTFNSDPNNNGAAFEFVASGSSSGFYGIAHLFGPNVAKPTAYQANGFRSTSSRTYVISYGTEDSSTQHTDFTLLVDGGGTATGGTIKVYGYQN